jgi:hypothetical protein
MSTIRASVNRFSSPGFLLITVTLALLLFAGLVAAESDVADVVVGSNCHHTIPAGTDAHIHLKNFMGSVEVRNGDKDKILVTADVSDDCVQIDKSGNMVGIKAVKEKGIRPINFVVSVPQSCAVTLECINCKVTAHDLRGDVEVQTHEGDIELYNISSRAVKINSINGRISFDGEILAGGHYIFDSINSVDLFLPRDASFDLTTTSEQERVDMGGFGLINSGAGRRITGKHGDGGAKVEVTSQGSIHFHRR